MLDLWRVWEKIRISNIQNPTRNEKKKELWSMQHVYYDCFIEHGFHVM